MMRQIPLELVSPPPPTFDNYVAGRNAEVRGRLAALAAGAPGEGCVYLWGVPGSGRTHLLCALAAAARAAGRRCHYVACTPETAQLPEIAGLDILLADDVERLPAAGQIALFNAYNALRERGAALVATGDAPAVQLPLRPDVVTRLSWGLVYQVHALTDEDKIRALADHAAARGFALTAEIAEYLLTHVARDLGSLVAMVDALDRYSLEAKRPVTLALVRELVRAREQARQLELPMNRDEPR